MRTSEPNRFPATLLAGLLVTATLLVVLLAVQAWMANVYHREQTEDVLRDYASLAGDEALRRIATEIGYYGYRSVIEALRERVAAEGDLPDLTRLREQSGEEVKDALGIAQAVFLFDPRTAMLRADPPELVPPDIAQSLQSFRIPGRGFSAAILRKEDQIIRFVFAPVDGARHRSERLVGFRVSSTELRRRSAEAIERRSLLPPSLGEGNLDNSVLYLRVLDQDGGELVELGSEYAEGLLVERQPPEEYRGVMEGLHVSVAIDPKAAHRLVIGGLPRSRLPFLLTLFALTTGLLVAASLLLRRERALIQLRSEFVSRVSHELRTPLAQIRMFVETLRLGRVRNDAERHSYLEILDRESQRLTTLVENVLQFSAAERRQLRLELRATAIPAVFERLGEAMRPSLEGAGCSLEVDVAPKAEAFADPDALHQMLLNLVDNAVKHGPPGQRIGLNARTAGGKTLIAVEDQGPGIPRGERERVWQPFHRVKGSSSGGTGIGLAVVHELAEGQSGRCWIESRHRQGIRIVIELPRWQVESE